MVNVLKIGTKHDIIESAPNRTLESAVLIMGNKKFRHLPITKLGKIRGILSVSDIFRTIKEHGLPDALNVSISEVMTEDPVQVRPESTVEDAIHIMVEKNIGSLLISDEVNGTLKGIITKRDILKNYELDSLSSLKLVDIGAELLEKEVSLISSDAPLVYALIEMSKKRLDRMLTHNKEGTIDGIFSANDITRLCATEREEISNNSNFLDALHVNYVASKKLITIDSGSTVSDAIILMKKSNIGALPVMDDDDEVIGMFTEGMYLRLLADKLDNK